MKEMGCKVDFADDLLSISTAGVQDVALEFSHSGHPVIEVTAFGAATGIPAEFRTPHYFIGGDDQKNGQKKVEKDVAAKPPEEVLEEPDQGGEQKKVSHGVR